LAQIKNVTNLRQNLFDYFAKNKTTDGFDFAKLDPNKLLLTDEDTKKLDAGMSVQDILAGKPLPKQEESKPAAAKPSEQKPGQPKKKYKKKIKVGDRIIEVEVEE
jgi:C-terminal processing protease CtpA/Prc